MPAMKQPDWGGYSGRSAQNGLKSEFAVSKHQMQSRFSEHNDKMNVQKDDLHTRRAVAQDTVKRKIQEGDGGIKQQGEQIKNEAHAIGLKGKARSEKGAFISAKDKAISTFFGGDEK
jgi:hypothetical protein